MFNLNFKLEELSDSAFKHKTTNNLKIACWSNHFQNNRVFVFWLILHKHCQYKTLGILLILESSDYKPCQLIQPERDPETKRQNEKIVTHKQEAAMEYTQKFRLLWDEFDKMLHEWFDTKLRKQFSWKHLFVELFLVI